MASAPSHCGYRKLGDSGLRISVPIFGCMGIGDGKSMPWAITENDALPLLKAAYDSGIRTWDTANVYSNGSSEAIVGKALREYQIPREKIVLMTKCFWGVDETPDRLHWLDRERFERSEEHQNQFGLSRAAIFNQVDASLARLDTTYIDVLQIHRFDTTTPIKETMKALHDLVQLGKVRYIGASSMYATQFARMQFCAERNGWTKFVSVQVQHSLLYREEEREMMRFCNEIGVGVISWAPLSRGNLSRPLKDKGKTTRSKMEAEDLTEADAEIIQRVAEVADKRNWSMAQVTLAWACEKVSSPIVGLSNFERVRDALGLTSKKLNEEERNYLEGPYKPKAFIVPETL